MKGRIWKVLVAMVLRAEDALAEAESGGEVRRNSRERQDIKAKHSRQLYASYYIGDPLCLKSKTCISSCQTSTGC